MATPMKFYDKYKAYVYAQGQNDLKPGNFCPLLRDKCRTDCVCWKHAYVKENLTYDEATKTRIPVWWVYAAQCENRMLDGGRFEL